MKINQLTKILKECKSGTTPSEYAKSTIEFYENDGDEYVFFYPPNRKIRNFHISRRGHFTELSAHFCFKQSLSDLAKTFVDSDIYSLDVFARRKGSYLLKKKDSTTDELLEWVVKESEDLVISLETILPNILWILNDPNMLDRWNFKRIHRLQQAAHDVIYHTLKNPERFRTPISKECLESIFSAFEELCDAGISVHQEFIDTRL